MEGVQDVPFGHQDRPFGGVNLLNMLQQSCEVCTKMDYIWFENVLIEASTYRNNESGALGESQMRRSLRLLVNEGKAGDV